MSAVPTSIFTARQRRYEQAIADFNDWFLSGQRGGMTYNRVIQDCELLAAIDAHKTAMLDTPAITLADVAAKVETLYGGCEILTDYSEPVDAAIEALRAGAATKAREWLERFLSLVVADPDPAWEHDYSHGAVAALADLQRMEVAP